MKPLQAGDLRHTILIQARTVSRTATGGYALSWATNLTCKAAIKTPQKRGGKMSVREYQYAAETRADVTHIIITRAQVATVTPDMRIVFGTRVFNIVGVNVIDEIRHELEIQTIEVAAVIAEDAVLNANQKEYTWGEIDFTTAQTIAIAVDSGKTFFPSIASIVCTTLTGTVTIQPTIKIGIGANHTKYLAATTPTLLTAIDTRQNYETLLANNGETDLWLEISVAGAVSSGSYRGAIYVSGDQL